MITYAPSSARRGQSEVGGASLLLGARCERQARHFLGQLALGFALYADSPVFQLLQSDPNFGDG